MAEKIIVEPGKNQVDHWMQLKRRYHSKRGHDAGPDKAIPATTYGDVKHLAEHWHKQFLRSARENYFLAHRDEGSRKRWKKAKSKIDKQLSGADMNALYPENQWFWGETFRVATHLRTMKTTPTRFELLVEAFDETIEERKAQVERGVKKAIGVGDDVLDAIKTGAMVVGGLAVAALVVPRLWRWSRDA